MWLRVQVCLRESLRGRFESHNSVALNNSIASADGAAPGGGTPRRDQSTYVVRTTRPRTHLFFEKAR